MLDIRFIRENPDAVKENIRKKFQEAEMLGIADLRHCHGLAVKVCH